MFAAVTEEVARLSGAETANMIRYQDDDTELVIGAWSEPGAANIPVGAKLPLDGNTAAPQIRRTGRPMRVDVFAPGDGPAGRGAPGAVVHRRRSARRSCSTGTLWGALILARRGAVPGRRGGSAAEFAELAAQALANAEAREQLAASRARLVSAGDAERRRLERNLHDGAQQRLVSLALLLRLASRHATAMPPSAPGASSRSRRRSSSTRCAELRELARGLHPAVLTDHGLEAGAAVDLRPRAGARRPRRRAAATSRPKPSQAAAYFVVAEALTNVAKYARATWRGVTLRAEDAVLTVDVTDDGVGGADPHQGSGLSGLADRVDALGGRLDIDSPPNGGTRIHVRLPL